MAKVILYNSTELLMYIMRYVLTIKSRFMQNIPAKFQANHDCVKQKNLILRKQFGWQKIPKLSKENIFKMHNLISLCAVLHLFQHLR